MTFPITPSDIPPVTASEPQRIPLLRRDWNALFDKLARLGAIPKCLLDLSEKSHFNNLAH